MSTPKLYKYKSLQGDSFKFTQDIFINKRLYLSSVLDFNDPNEGIGEILIENEYKVYGNLLEERNRKSTRVFSLSEDYKNPLMWSHYANHQTGICIEFDFSDYYSDGKSVLRKVEYLKKPKQFSHEEMNNYFEFFVYKKDDWSYEKEWRIIADKNTIHHDLTNNNICKIYLGPRISKGDIEWVKFWTKFYNQDKDIPIVQMSYLTTKYDLIEDENTSKSTKRLIV